MTDARAEMLQRVRSALGDAPVVPEVPRAYHGPGAAPVDVDLFCERVADYKATVHRVAAGEVDRVVGQILAGHGAEKVVGTLDLDGLVADDPPLDARALDALDGVITGCALGIAETGTIVLDGAQRSGRRALTLVPDLHVCVVEEEQIVASVPDAVAQLAEAAAAGRPITLVSGPSATSDIELDRVEGVHGPRRLEVLVVAPAPRA
ncbi:MAG TPA: LUD domain-containing protein [Solirubrobacteraceae bacterium]|nr:LUD domain-containing protein [Solirubrobacteraceae bacterium]